MIKIISIIGTLLATFICEAQTEERIVEVNFSGRNCLSRGGVCDIKTDSTITSNRSNMKAIKTYKQSQNSLIIEIDALNLSSEDQSKFFGKEYSKIAPNEALFFIQEDDFIFDIETLIYLDLDLNYRFLKRGNYPLVIENDKILVTLTLSRD